MRISMIATTDIGGAGRAAVRLLDGLNSFSDIDVSMIVKDKRTTNPKIKSICTHNPFFDYISHQFFFSNVPENHALTSIMYSGTENQYLAMLKMNEIVHLHWVSNFVSAESLRYLEENGQGLVWTFHDRNPMTGGCHCTYDCNKYETDCNECPEMVNNPFNISKNLFAIKKEFIPKSLVVVAPSQWMADCARKSAIFHNHRIEVIPNSVDLNLFHRVDKNEAKKSFNIDPKNKVILYCAEMPQQIHKGFKYFLEAIKHLKENTCLRNWFLANDVMIIVVGSISANISHDIQSLNVPFKMFGRINDDSLLAKIYASADLTVFPSLEESFGNVIIESLSCGTPVVGFNVGGMPDIIINGMTGFSVERRDAKALGDRMADVLSNNKDWSKTCREYAELHFSQSLQVRKYRELYDDIMETSSIQHYNTKAFALPYETHALLAPYYFKAMEYAIGLGERALVDFMRGSPLEESVIDYAITLLQVYINYPNKSIAIWGKGAFAKKFLAKVLNAIPEFRDKLAGFFDNDSDGNGYLDFPLLDKERINDYALQMILICSVKFEDEIFHQIKSFQNQGILIVRPCYQYQKAQFDDIKFMR